MVGHSKHKGNKGKKAKRMASMPKAHKHMTAAEHKKAMGGKGMM